MSTYTVELVAFSSITSNLLKTTFGMMARRGYPLALHTDAATTPQLHLIDGDRFDACEVWRRNHRDLKAPLVFLGKNPYDIDAVVIPKPLKWDALCNGLMQGIGQEIPQITAQWRSEHVEPVAAIYIMNREMVQKPRILIVDDSVTIRKYLSMKIQSFGFPVDTAENAERAFDYMRLQKYSAVFMDVMMPEMDGYEACRILRKAQQFTGPVIMITSLDSPFDKMRAQIAGSSDFITKPIDESVLTRVLEKVLRKHDQIRMSPRR